MSATESDGFPRRDADGRISHLPDLVGTVLAGLVIGVLALVVLDWGFALLGAGEFGGASGWLALILPAWVFVEEFRAWGDRPTRIVAALVAAAVAVVLGLAAAGVVSALSPLWTGAIGAAVSALTYSLIWFVGVRWLVGRTG